MTHRTLRKLYCRLAGPSQRWPALITLVAIGGLYAALPKQLIPLPDSSPLIGVARWFPMALVLAMSLPLVLTSKARKHRMNAWFAHALLGVLTFFMVVSLILLIEALPKHLETPGRMLRSAASLWITNVLVFACWYWRLDAGGPAERAHRAKHEEGSFLFPQMTLSPELLQQLGQDDWKPSFVDYLFLAFNSSTALSPTDTPVLSRWGKGLMMIQSGISLTIVILLAARAVNIL